MIYINFLYFIIAIFAFIAAPVVPTTLWGLFDTSHDLLALAVGFFVFRHICRNRFFRLAKLLDNEEISLEGARHVYARTVNQLLLMGLLLFAASCFLLDLKAHMFFLLQNGALRVLLNPAGLAVFIGYLAVVWHLGFKTMGRQLQLADNSRAYVIANIKFNLGIVLPWLALTVISEILALIPFPFLEPILDTPLFNLISFVIFLLALVIVGPALVVRLWDCEPLPPGELRDKIEAFCEKRQVRFKEICSWNALNKGLVTAGVIGLVPRFRYLMLTPQLMNILDENEIMAVVSHEVGHVTKKHHFLYLFYFTAFFAFIAGAADNIWAILNRFFLSSDVILEAMRNPDSAGGLNLGTRDVLFVVLLLVMFILYFRFIFGYFMRNFERQADGVCFEDGTDPNLLITSFMKLGFRLGDDGKKKNWHHYNLSQRIEFIRNGIRDPQTVKRHDRQTKSRVLMFSVIMSLVIMLSFYLQSQQSHLRMIADATEKRLEETPEDVRLYVVLGGVYYELKEWKKCKKAYNYAVGLDYNQPETLNNLAWLLLTSEDKEVLDPKRALKLAGDAAKRKQEPHILDTLAEAYYQNDMYWEAFQTSKKAHSIAVNDVEYFKRQLDKMKKALRDKTGAKGDGIDKNGDTEINNDPGSIKP